MGLRAKFNFAILGAFAVGFVLAAFVLDRVFVQNAREEVLQNARILMAAAGAVRNYTANDLARLLPVVVDGKFVPETIPAYAAQRNLRELLTPFDGFTYREPTLNPTNLSDRPQDWEADIINILRAQPARHEVVIERDTPTGRTLHMARPITVHEQACLLCHSEPGTAPAALTRSYGLVNGFGWKMNETVGAQMLSVPMDVPLQRAHAAFITFMALLVGIFAVIALVLNALLHYLVLRPVARVAAMANAVSLGEADVETYIKPGNDEISSLSVSFDRMRQSLDHAMRMLKA